MKVTKRIKLILLFLFIGIGALALFKYFPSKSIDNCKNPTKLEDYTDGKERLVICKDSVKYGSTVVTTKDKTPGVFEYVFDEDDTWEPTHEVVVYKIDNKDYVAIFPVINPQSWYMRSGYIFQKQGEEFKLIFNKTFKDLSGRWTGVRFDENGSLFESSAIAVNQDFGEMGFLGQRISWRDYYTWDPSKNTYVLANNEMSFRLDEMRKYYDETDLEACGNESPSLKGERISELFEIRKNFDHFCDDSSPHPYISNKQAEMFLKAKKALDEIGQGKNYSFNEIKNIDLE